MHESNRSGTTEQVRSQRVAMESLEERRMMSADAGNTIDTAAPIAVPSVIHESISPKIDVDFFKIDLAQSQAIDFDIDLPAGSQLDPKIDFYNGANVFSGIFQTSDNANAPGENKSGTKEAYARIFLPGGQYAFAVSSVGGNSTGNYDLAVSHVNDDPDDQISEAKLAKIGAGVQGQWSNYRDVDLYKFHVSAKSRIAFQVNDPANPGWLDYHSNIALFDSAGNFVRTGYSTDYYDPSYFEAKFDAAGDYYVAVSFEYNRLDSFYSPPHGFDAVTGDNDFPGLGSPYENFQFPISYELKTTVQPYAPAARVDVYETQGIFAGIEAPAGSIPGVPGAVANGNTSAYVISYRSTAGGISWRDSFAFASISAVDIIEDRLIVDASGGDTRLNPANISFRRTGEISSVSFEELLVDNLTLTYQLASVHLRADPLAPAITDSSVDPEGGNIYYVKYQDATAVADFRLTSGTQELVGVNLAINQSPAFVASYYTVTVTPPSLLSGLPLITSLARAGKFDELFAAYARII